MSAICGILYLDGQAARPEALEPMLTALAPYGLDGSGVWHDTQILLGQQLTHTTPESRHERLPLWHSESTTALLADARLDNRDELAATLGLADHPERPDSAFILAAWQQWGEACVDHLEGDYLIVIWDQSQRTLFCAIDPTGRRTLFYHHNAHHFAFASIHKGLLAAPGVPHQFDETHLVRRTLYPTVTTLLHPGRTCYHEIRFLAGGRTLRLTPNRSAPTIRHYWQAELPAELPIRSDGELREAFQATFNQALRPRLRSAWPVGSLLSGGLDSSGIVAAAAPLLAAEGRSLHTFSAVSLPGLGADATDERHYIDAFRTTPNLHFHLHDAPERGPFDPEQLDYAATHQGPCPGAYSRRFLYIAFFEEAQRLGIRTLLDGCGGELSATHHGEQQLLHLLLRGAWPTLGRELVAKSRIEERPLPRLLLQTLLKPLLPRPLLPLLRPATYNAPRPHPFQRDYLNAHLSAEELRHLQRTHIHQQLSAPRELRRDQQRAILKSQLAPGGGHSEFGITVIQPYYDRRLLRFGLALPGAYQHRNGYKRYPLRGGLEGLLPPRIQWRPGKQPFCCDYHHRYNRQLPQVAERLAAYQQQPELTRRFDIPRLLTLTEIRSCGLADSNEMVWNSLMLLPQSLQLLHFFSQQRSEPTAIRP